MGNLLFGTSGSAAEKLIQGLVKVRYAAFFFGLANAIYLLANMIALVIPGANVLVPYHGFYVGMFAGAGAIIVDFVYIMMLMIIPTAKDRKRAPYNLHTRIGWYIFFTVVVFLVGACYLASGILYSVDLVGMVASLEKSLVIAFLVIGFVWTLGHVLLLILMFSILIMVGAISNAAGEGTAFIHVVVDADGSKALLERVSSGDEI